jgi:uncharacterized membrane protein YhaH (DUF805 family)
MILVGGGGGGSTPIGPVSDMIVHRLSDTGSPGAVVSLVCTLFVGGITTGIGPVSFVIIHKLSGTGSPVAVVVLVCVLSDIYVSTDK